MAEGCARLNVGSTGGPSAHGGLEFLIFVPTPDLSFRAEREI